MRPRRARRARWGPDLHRTLVRPEPGGGRVEVDATLRSVGRPAVSAVGNCQAVPDLARGGVCPPTAQHALRQGRAVADNITATAARRAGAGRALRR